MIVNPLGLHARAAAQLVRLAGRFSSRILITRRESGVVADAKSLLSLLTLAASVGTPLEISVEGTDEADALASLEKLFASGFNEI